MPPANLRRPSALRAILGARCLASRCPALRLASGRFVTGARAGIRPSLRLAFASVVRPEPSDFRRRAFARAETASLYRPQVLRLGACASRHCASDRPGSWPVRCHRVAPTLGVSRLAFGRGLLHAVSRSARGQMSPPSLGSKPPVLQGLAAFGSSCLVSRRQVQSAPESAI